MKLTTRQLTVCGLLAALSTVIMFLEFNLPFIPPFLKLDFSDVPALIGAVLISPAAGVLTIVIKNMVHLLMTSTGGAGEFANMTMGCCYILPISLTYGKGAAKTALGVALSIILMTLAAMITNYFVLLPWYSKVMPLDTVIEMCAGVNPLIKSKADIVIYGVAPFNIAKGVINTAFCAALLRYLPKKI